METIRMAATRRGAQLALVRARRRPRLHRARARSRRARRHGADGREREQARHIVSCTRYPPAGTGLRSSVPDDYENDNHVATMAKANREIMVIADRDEGRRRGGRSDRRGRRRVVRLGTTTSRTRSASPDSSLARSTRTLFSACWRSSRERQKADHGRHSRGRRPSHGVGLPCDLLQRHGHLR